MGKKGTSEEAGWMEWDEYDVGKWMKECGLEKFGKVFVENEIKGETLPECLEEKMLAELVDKGFWRQKIMAAISQLVSSSSDLEPSQPTSARKAASTVEAEGSASKELPPGKETHFFGSHKKEHSVYGDTSESLGIRLKDILEASFGLKGWFDLDDLKTIDEDHIQQAIIASCCVLVLLHDETKQSQWCQAEWQCAKENRIPLIVVVDIDKFPARQLIKTYIEDGYDFLFGNQVINYSSTHRKACYSMVAQAIEGVINQYDDSFTVESKPRKTIAAETSSNDSSGGNRNRQEWGKSKRSGATRADVSIHESNMDAQAIDNHVRRRITKRKQWKSALKRLGITLSDASRKAQRKRISSTRVITLQELTHFIDGEQITTAAPSKTLPILALLPKDLPELPPNFQQRTSEQQALIGSLIGNNSGTVSLTAPKSRRQNKITSLGMGGCGKTTLTVAAIRSTVVRRHFDCIAWVAVSMTPKLLVIYNNLYLQLVKKPLPDEVAGNPNAAFNALQQSAQGRIWLVVADDCWSDAISMQLGFLDDSTDSKLLISTRIKNLVADAKEIQLGLLSLQESIELLVNMSGIHGENSVRDSSDVLRLVHLSGRLPLTLCVVAGMVKSFGKDWQDNVPAMLEEDFCGSLAEAGTSLSPAEVVVNRSIKELPDQDAKSLFFSLAIVPEDVPCPPDIVELIFKSVHPEVSNNRKLKLRVRRTIETLLRYNLCLGSNTHGIYFHDIVRDFSRAALGVKTSQMKNAQRKFLQEAVKIDPADLLQSITFELYFSSALLSHMKDALLPPSLPDDALLALCLDHGQGMDSIITDCAACAVGAKYLAAQADAVINEDKFYAARLLYLAACVEPISAAAVEAQQLMLRAARVYTELEQEEPRKFTILHRTIEYSARNDVKLYIPWDTEEHLFNASRLVELYDKGVNITSPLQLAKHAVMLLYSTMPAIGEYAEGVGNQRKSSSYSKAAETIFKGCSMLHEASQKVDNIKGNAYRAAVTWALTGFTPSWFLDPEEVATVQTAELLRAQITHWDRDAQQAAELQLAGMEYTLMFNPSLSQIAFFGAVDDASLTMDKLITLHAQNPIAASSEPDSFKMAAAIGTHSPATFTSRAAGAVFANPAVYSCVWLYLSESGFALPRYPCAYHSSVWMGGRG